MLNLFPIQWLALLAYFILRLVVGLVLLWLAHKHVQHYRSLVSTTTWPWLPQRQLPISILILSEFAIGFLLVIGLLTQAAAIGLFLLSAKILIWRNRFSHPYIPERLTYVLLLGAALSLFITGAGSFAFDLPI